MRKGKSPLIQSLQKAFAIARKSNQTGIPVDELIEMERMHSINRKNFIKHTALAGVAIGASGLLDSCKKEEAPAGGLKRDVKIGIVGAGIAGLHAAYVLKKAGYYTRVFEASDRAGGRMFSSPGLVADGVVTEMGGEFIDSDHQDMLDLAAEFGFSLLDTQVASETALNAYAYYFNNQAYSLTDLATVVQQYLPVIQADIDSLPDVIGYQNTAGATDLDMLSITNYLDSRGISGWFRSFIVSAYTTEYGLNADEQSSINLLFLIGVDANNNFSIFGGSDERYKIAGGNQQIPLKLAQEVPEVNYSSALQRIRRTGTGYTLSFNGSREYFFDYVVLAIPFTILRNIDIQVDLPTVKKKSIAELGYGTNAKVIAGFNSRPWRDLGNTGYSFTDQPFMCGWDSSQLQAGTNGAFTFFNGGTEGKYCNNIPAPQKAQEYLTQLDKMYPGASPHFNGKSNLMHWPGYQYTLGSYASYKVSQWTSIAGAEIETVDKLYFAGEHCSFDFQGYMNGGAETGRRAAEAILLKITV